MSKEQTDQFMRPNDSSQQQQDVAESSLHNLNKQLKDFEHRFKGYHMQKPFSDSQSDEQIKTKPVSNIVANNVKKQTKEQVNRMAQIKDQIKWKDTQIEQLIKLEGDGIKDKKIKQLAQKVKLLSINLEKQKNTKKKVENQLQITKTNPTSTSRDMKKSIKINNDDSDLKNKLVQAQKQVMEMRLKNQNLKNELNKAMRVISRQIGQQANIDEILSQDNAWKGRQQKIQHLRGKVKQLEMKLSNNSINESHMSGFTMMTNEKSSKQQTTINNLSDNRRKQMQNLKVQVQALKSQNEILQGKVKALASRKGTLQTEVKQIKTEFEKKQKIFKQKSENDDKYISLLKSQNQKLKKQQKVVTKLVYKNSGAENQNQKKQIQKLKLLLSKKDNQIKSLQQKLQSKPIKPQSRQLRPKSIDKTQKVIQKKIQELQKQYDDEDKVDQSLTAQQEEAVYKQWKENKFKQSK